jgi:Dyp-type peroxidase family
MVYPVQPEPPVQPTPPDPRDLRLRDSDQIQGNILAGFRKDHEVLLFLGFGDPAQAKSWMAGIAPRIATTKQVSTFNVDFSQARRNSGGDPQNLKAVWVNIALTSHGIRALDPNLGGDLDTFTALSQGPVTRAPQLGDVDDGDPIHWIVGGPSQAAIDALLIVAADDPDDLTAEVARQRSTITANGVTVLFEQIGNTLPANRAGHEHFGFKDGISQPGVIGFDEPTLDGTHDLRHPGSELIAPGQFVFGQPLADGSLATAPSWMANGSFLVFRRLAQDVPGFWSNIETAAAAIAAGGPSADQLGAKVVGRWRSGTPLANAPDRDNRSAHRAVDDNEFTYEDDPGGTKTPRFAHIRKVYPRDDAFDDDEHRIIRRGIPFGRPFDPAGGRGHGVDADRGLLFLAYMASIENQFEFIQTTWADNATFQQPGDGPDPVIGTSPGDGNALPIAGGATATLSLRRWVRTTGAVYLFAPSIGTLIGLGS